MKKLRTVLIAVLFLCFALAVPALANQNLQVPSGVGYSYDRDGNGYAPTAAGIISVPERYIADFINAGYAIPNISAVLCGTTAACASTQVTKTLVYIGKITLLVQTPATGIITGLNFANTNYICTATDTTRGMNVQIAPGTNTSAWVMGQAGSTINYMCIGQ